MLDILRSKVDDFRASRVKSSSANRKALADIPASLYPYWKRTARFEFKGIPQDAFFFARAADALITFFECMRHSGKACALPSKAADSVWHAWLKMAPGSLEAFQITHFGRRFPHVEWQAMPVRMDAALANCLVAARKREGIHPEGPRLPALFAADRVLRMPGGFSYAVQRGEVVLANMDDSGRPERSVFLQSALAPAGLLAAGLIGSSEYERFLERKRPSDGGCGSTGSSCGSVSCSDGGGGGDSGGCDGGGSSCGGGGCGGGGGD